MITIVKGNFIILPSAVTAVPPENLIKKKYRYILLTPVASTVKIKSLILTRNIKGRSHLTRRGNFNAVAY